MARNGTGAIPTPECELKPSPRAFKILNNSLPKKPIESEMEVRSKSPNPIDKPMYNKVLLKDPKFKEFYAENMYRAVSTFPKFARNYSKNYKSV